MSHKILFNDIVACLLYRCLAMIVYYGLHVTLCWVSPRILRSIFNIQDGLRTRQVVTLDEPLQPETRYNLHFNTSFF